MIYAYKYENGGLVTPGEKVTAIAGGNARIGARSVLTNQRFFYDESMGTWTTPGGEVFKDDAKKGTGQEQAIAAHEATLAPKKKAPRRKGSK